MPKVGVLQAQHARLPCARHLLSLLDLPQSERVLLFTLHLTTPPTSPTSAPPRRCLSQRTRPQRPLAQPAGRHLDSVHNRSRRTSRETTSTLPDEQVDPHAIMRRVPRNLRFRISRVSQCDCYTLTTMDRSA